MMKEEIQDKLKVIASEVKRQTGINIDNLKPSFLERRVLNRMRQIGKDSYEDYIRVLSANAEEAKALYRTFSINVTKFFRDPHVWEKIRSDILPQFVKSTRLSPIEIWSCGCASGEEPYSISIMMSDFLKNKQLSYKIFATDINMDALNHAQNGIYREDNLVNVAESNKKECFDKVSEREYRVKPYLKKPIVFQRTDMLKDAGRLFDIIFCRNVLIYYDKNTHEQIFMKFHKALKKGGFLVLGQDESMIGTKGYSIFELVYPREIIYKKI